jgi:putative transposase
VEARTEFIRAWNSGLAWPELFEALGRRSLTWQAIEGWRGKLKRTGDPLKLHDERSRWRRGQRVVNDQQLDIALRCALSPNRPRISEAIRTAWAVMHQRGIPNGSSASSYRRRIIEWRDSHYDIWVFAREGAKAWNDQCALQIERDMDKINVGDVLVADGKVLDFEIINPWTGRPKRMTMILWYDMRSNMVCGWEIMPTERTAAINAALRRAIITLGKIPQVAYLDNGKAFGARFFEGQPLTGVTGVYKTLGIQVVHTWPYHGQSKPVERFFGTFGELERMAPTYVGGSVDAKPPRLHRGERLHRRLHETFTGGAGVTLEQAHRAIAAWFDAYARRPQSSDSHLRGQCPLEVFEAGRGPGIDPLELRFLMMAHTITATRKSAIRFLGRTYHHEALGGIRHPVEIRYDLQDPSAIVVLHPDSGELICEACAQGGCHPMASILGTDEDREHLSEMIRRKKSQEKDAASFARDTLENSVLPEMRRQHEALGITLQGPAPKPALPQLPPPPAPHVWTPDEEAAHQAKAAAIEYIDLSEAPFDPATAELPEVIDLSEKPSEPAELPEVVMEDALQLKHRLELLSEPERYAAIVEMEVRGILVPNRWQAFARYFEISPEYFNHRERYAQLRAELAATWQVEGRSQDGRGRGECMGE